jgi:hypothetical protein
LAREESGRCDLVADAAEEAGHAGEADRHVGAEAEADPRQGRFRQSEVPQPVEAVQGSRGVGRAAADAGGHGQALGQANGGAERPAGLGGERARGLQNEVVIGGVQGVAEGAVEGEREIGGRREFELVAGRSEGDQAVEQMVAVGPPADDVQVEVELGRRGQAERAGCR